MDSKLSEILAQGFGGWEVIGLLGMITFSSRFIIQWIVSERRKESVIPISFWYLSSVGSLLLVSYALHKADPVFILCYLFNCLIYFRNLCLIFAKEKETGEAI